MNRIHSSLLVALGLIVLSPASDMCAQERRTTDDASRFGPGIVTIIDPQPMPEETFSGPLPLQEFLAKHPEIDWKAPDFPNGKPYYNSRSQTLIEQAQDVILRREIHAFEFAFKPMRQMYVDIPQATGVMKRKLIWYLTFRIRYRGGDLRAKEVVNKFGSKTYPSIESVSYQARRCFPMMVLSVPSKGKEYVDRVIPAARQQIAQREQISSKLHNTVEISTLKIPRTTADDSPGVWGYATWEDIDPNTDFFSIFVHGLTNAFQIVQKDGEESVRRKVLRLNFYRPGDTIKQLADDIRFGIPAFEDMAQQNYVLKQYRLPERLDYEWLFR